MRDYLGDLLFGGFVIVLIVIFLRDWEAATNLIQGFTGAYTKGVTELANLGGKAST